MEENQTLTYKYLNTYSTEEQLTHIMNKLNLKQPFLCGIYNNKEKPHYFDSLSNPFTGKKINEKNNEIVGGVHLRKVIYDQKNNSSVKLTHGEKYIFQIVPYGIIENDNTDQESAVSKNEIVYNKVIRVKSYHEVLLKKFWDESILKKNMEELNKIEDELNVKNLEINTLDENIIKKDLKLSELNVKVEAIEEKELRNNKLQTELIEKEKEFQIQQDQLNNQREVLEEKERDFKALKKDIKIKEAFFNKLFNQDGYINEDNDSRLNNNDETKVKNVTFSEIQEHHINNIIVNIFEKEKLSYSSNTIKNILASLSVGKELFTILYGPSGTGKTSIIKSLADSIGARYKIIPVQSSWLDRQELLGYYNPLDKHYNSTPFLDAIIEAHNDPKRLVLICLDEINLSDIELYFADILSLIEHSDSIELYSSHQYDNNLQLINYYLREHYDLDNIEEYVNSNIELTQNTNFETSLKYYFLARNLIKYKSTIKIPDNIRFIGTMNIDGTTKSLSPKVIDRSYLIEIKNEKNYNQKAVDNLKRKMYSDNFIISPTTEKFELKRSSKYDLLSKKLDEINSSLNHRTYNQIALLENALKNIGKESEKNINSIIIKNKILPRINTYINHKNRINIIDEIEKEIFTLTNENSPARKKFEEMKGFASENQILSFWR